MKGFLRDCGSFLALLQLEHIDSMLCPVGDSSTRNARAENARRDEAVLERKGCANAKMPDEAWWLNPAFCQSAMQLP